MTFAQFKTTIDRCETIIKEFFPVPGKTHTLVASNFKWSNVDVKIAEDVTLQKKYKLEDKSLFSTLTADMSVVENKSGKVLDSRNKYIVFQFPHITSRNSYIVNGTEKQVINQLRWRPGIYATHTTSGDIDVTFNTTAAGSYRVLLNRTTLVMTFRVGPSTNFPIVSVLGALGMNDVDIQTLLGQKMYQINKAKAKDKDVNTLLRKFRPYLAIPADLDESKKLIKEFLESKPLDPEVNKVTVNEPISAIDLAALRAAVIKAIDLANGKTEPDDVESLAFKSIMSIEDFIPEVLLRAMPEIKKRVAGLVDRKPRVLAAFPPSTLTILIENFFNKSEFTRYADQNNPLDIAAVSSVTTVMGEGGIQSTHAIEDEVRTIHPSHLGLLDPMHTPEGQKIGITTHLTLGARKIGQSLYTDVYDAKTGERVQKSVQDLVNKVVAFPDQYSGLGQGTPEADSKEIKARKGTKYLTVTPKEVDYIFVSPDHFFSTTTLAIPFLPNNDANRVMMGDKHIEQAVNLKDPDKPYVMHLIKGKTGSAGYEELFGKPWNIAAPVNGKVTKITDDKIYIKPSKGKTVPVSVHHYYPLNSATFLHDTPTVKIGDRVKAGQPIAQNNFTKDDTLALGKNLKVAYMAYKGYNFEDGVVISEGAAKKLTSVHKYELRVDLDKNTKAGCDIYTAAFPQELQYIRERKTRYDDDGIIKKGTTVEPGDIVIPAFQQIPLHAEFDYKRLGKKLGDRAFDVSQRWDGMQPAEVIDVIKMPSFVKVILKSEEQMKIGDKLSHRHGGKGIVTLIIPDAEMYKDTHGNTIDVLFNPAGVGGRVNVGQLYETAAGKIAEKTGKPYYAENFNAKENSTLAKLQKDMKAAGVVDAEDIVDPKTGEVVKNVLVGPLHFVKLKHQVDTKFKARAANSESYTLDQQPAKTDESSAQRIGILDTFTLLSGNATAFLNDAFGLKSQKNDEYWIALQQGVIPPPPKVPFITEKFVTMLLGAGINLRQQGSRITAAPMTDKEILRISRGEIDKSTVIKSNNLMPEKGGLFDPAKVGGIAGNRFNHIKLVEPIPNPLMEEAIVSVAKLPKKESLTSIIAGNLAVSDTGELITDTTKGAVGGNGVVNLLKNIDVKREIKLAEAETKTLKGEKLNKSFKRLRYLRALDRLQLTPTEAYVNTVVPIIPAKFRSIQPKIDGSLSVPAANHGYREIIMINNQLKKLKESGVDQENTKNLSRDLYRAVSGLSGLTSPLTRADIMSGFIEKITGPGGPKTGYFQSKVLTRAQDLSARSTVIPNPKLGLDEIGIPTEMALTIYKPFVVKRLVNSGYTPLKAREMVENKEELAIRMTQMEAEERPVLMNRAPSLHKFNMLSFKPRLITGRAVEVNPLIVGGYNMDFDGDTAGIHVPVSEEARRQAKEQLLPSRNLISIRQDSVVHAPTKETLYGLYLMSYPVGEPKVSVSKPEELQTLYNQKKIKINDAVTVGGSVHCLGQYLLDSLIPAKIKLGPVTMTAGKLEALLYKVARETKPDEAASIITALKDYGNKYATEVGYAISLKDLEIDTKKRNEIMSEARSSAKIIGFDKASIVALKKIQALVKDTTGSRFVDSYLTSGALGKKGEIGKMLATPVAVEDHKGNTIPTFINNSYAEGHDLGSYISTTPGARKGMIDKGISVADTGYFNRQLVNSTIEYKITENDCGTSLGVTMPLTSPEIYDRYGATGPVRNKLMTPEYVRQLLASGKKSVIVRSPLTCQSVNGVCAKCFGLNESGQLPTIVSHVGVLAGQTLGERATQIALKSFHCLHEQTMLLVRENGRIFHSTLSTLFDRDAPTTEEDGEEIKQISVEVWDKGGWVKTKTVRKHPQQPGTTMVMVRPRSGYALICQDNHPNMLAENLAVCSQCGTYPKKVSKTSRKYQCRKCGYVWDSIPEPSSDYLMVEPQELSTKSHCAYVDTGPAPTAATPPLKSGWLAGIYCAEGYTITNKQYGTVGVAISQNLGNIHDKIGEELFEEFGREYHRRPKGYQIYGKERATLFEKNFRRYSRNKQLPEGWSGYPKEWLTTFVSGVFDGDGTFVTNDDSLWVSGRIDTTSFLLAQQLHWLLRSWGVQSRLILTPWRKRSLYQGYAVTFVITEVVKSLFSSSLKLKTITGKSEHNNERFESVVDYVRPVRFDAPPFVYDIETESGTYIANGVWTHNTGGAIGGTKLGFDRVKEIVEMKKNIKNKAVLASIGGAVQKIEQSPTGGWFVYIKDVKHFVPKELGLAVSVRNVVRAGDMLSQTGTVKPQELLEYTGSINQVRNLLVDELSKNYSQENGSYVKRKVIETIVRPLTDKAKVTDAGDASDRFGVYPGDVVQVNAIKNYNKQLRDKKQKEIKFEPFLLSVKDAPFYSEDFIGQLVHERLKRTLSRAPALGQSADYVTGHPMTQLGLKNLKDIESIKTGR